MRHPKVNYAEGTWFAVPLGSGGFAVGLVARATPKGPSILAYFFGPKRESVPTLAEVLDLSAQSAIKVWRSSDLYLIDGSWQIIGRSPDFRRSDWPFPKFLRSNEIACRAWVVQYSEDDPGREIAETPIEYGTSALEPGWGWGCGAVEKALTKHLASSTDKGAQVAPVLPSPSGPQRNGPPICDHFFYVADRAKGEALATKLRGDGFDVQIKAGVTDGNWLVLAKHPSPDEAELDRLNDEFEKLAASFGGNYDGWERDVA